jgi:hypothetical protein
MIAALFALHFGGFGPTRMVAPALGMAGADIISILPVGSVGDTAPANSPTVKNVCANRWTSTASEPLIMTPTAKPPIDCLVVVWSTALKLAARSASMICLPNTALSTSVAYDLTTTVRVTAIIREVVSSSCLAASFTVRGAISASSLSRSRRSSSSSLFDSAAFDSASARRASAFSSLRCCIFEVILPKYTSRNTPKATAPFAMNSPTRSQMGSRGAIASAASSAMANTTRLTDQPSYRSAPAKIASLSALLALVAVLARRHTATGLRVFWGLSGGLLIGGVLMVLSHFFK